MIVKPYDVHEEKQVEELACIFNAHLKSPVIVNKAKVRQLLWYSISYPNNFFCNVIKDEEKVVGCLFGVCVEGLYHDDKIASEVGWFVLPEYRGSKASIKILKEFELWARDKAKATYITMMYTSDSNDLSRLYTKLDYVIKEFAYVKKL